MWAYERGALGADRWLLEYPEAGWRRLPSVLHRHTGGSSTSGVVVVRRAAFRKYYRITRGGRAGLQALPISRSFPDSTVARPPDGPHDSPVLPRCDAGQARGTAPPTSRRVPRTPLLIGMSKPGPSRAPMVPGSRGGITGGHRRAGIG